MRALLAFLLVIQFAACSTEKLGRPGGDYTLMFSVGQFSIPARLRIDTDSSWHILNAEEDIHLDSVVLIGDSFYINLPLFDSSIKGVWSESRISGVWTDHSRVDYHIPFAGFKTPVNQPAEPSRTDSLRYEITFSPIDSSTASRGIALLQKSGRFLSGTILTETGDYRFLEGEQQKDSIWLSAFDGTHLFYLRGTLRNDSLVDGVFLSGKHWKEDWHGVKSATLSLRSPFEITSTLVQKNPTFMVLNEWAEPIEFSSSNWLGKVSVIQVMGSWCPNCTDESVFLKQLYASHKSQGLQIIPVAFERGDDITRSCARVRMQFNQLALEYPFYYGGKSSKEDAHKALPFLTEVHSFPTSIFIDKHGIIRRIYTGFYGPGTHKEYTHHTEEIAALVEQLLAE